MGVSIVPSETMLHYNARYKISLGARCSSLPLRDAVQCSSLTTHVHDAHAREGLVVV